jgi:Kef-type K+ transport system membrane component KefB/nucleotide-binding universal stress UspA family protein
MHNEILILLIQVASLLLFARLFGEIAQRLGQPSVVGEILAGILLGPTFLGNFSIIADYIIPSNQNENYISIIGMIGAMFLLFIAGMETDIKLIKHHSKNALAIAFTALTISFVSLFIYSLTIPENLISNSNKYVFAFFVAITISVSAISVIAKVLIDLNLIRRDFGQLFVAIGLIDEAVAWILISVIIGLVGGFATSFTGIAFSFVKVIMFLILGYVVGKFLIKHLITFMQNKMKLRDKFLSLSVFIIFVYGAIAQSLGLEAVLGAFVAGIVFGQIPYLSEETIHKLESLTFAIFAPIFFATAGLQVNVLEFADPQILIISLTFMIIAFSSKALGGYIGARFFAKTDNWTAIGFGVGLNTRGTIQIILASIGLTIGIISRDIFSIIIIISIVSSLISPILIKSIIKRIIPNSDELKRIKLEKIYAESILSKINRVLLPVRFRTDLEVKESKSIEILILEALGINNKIDLTLFTVTNDSNKNDAQKFLDKLGKSFKHSNVSKKLVISDKAAEKILEEAKKDYNLLIVGATEKIKNTETVFNTFIDNLIRFSPCSSMIVQGHSIIDPNKIKRILVPTDGSKSSKKAVEVAFALATNEDDEVHILRVIEESPAIDGFDMKDHLFERQFNYAQEIVDEFRVIGESLSVKTFTKVELGLNPETVILTVAKDFGFDLVLLGSDVRPGSDKLYLGPRVEHILHNCTCPVIVVNSF